MLDENVNVGSDANPPARRGKIARLPDEIREQVNQRLLNGQPAADILPWLNSLPAVIETLAAQFHGEPITPQNLSNWRRGGYQHWLKRQHRLCQIKQFGQYASTLSAVQRDQMTAGTAVLASSNLFEFLESSSDEPKSVDDILKITSAVRPFLEADQQKARLELMASRMRLRDEQLQLTLEKQCAAPGSQGHIQPNPG